MKKIIYILFLVILSSCSDNFLSIYPETSLNEEIYYKSEQEFILLANGCYVPMRDYEKTLHWILAEMISDNSSFQYNATAGSATSGREAIDMFLPASNYTTYFYFWNLSYNGITRCNKLLFEITRPEVTWSKKSYIDRCSGEALFLRSLYYFNLVRQFGGVPIVLEPVTSQAAVNIKRSTEVQVYDQIIADLNKAVTLFSTAVEVEENGRANLGSANALLGKVYLTLHKYDEAGAALKLVIDSKKYDLLPNYADLFNPSKKDFKETIFAMQHSENNTELSNQFIFWFAPNTSGGAVTLRPNINISGSGGYNQPTEDLINAFETGDQRKNISIGVWTGKDWDGVVRPIAYCAKYKAPITAPDNRCSDNFPIIRYSDVLLMYAETLNEKGKTSEAISFIEQVRKRAGLTVPLSSSDKTSVQAIIAKERQVEFCFENQRWYDLKRTGKALEVMAAHGVKEKSKKTFLYTNSFELSSNKLLAPIPSEQVLINKIDQNPGY